MAALEDTRHHIVFMGIYNILCELHGYLAFEGLVKGRQRSKKV